MGYSHRELHLSEDSSWRIVFDQLGFPQIIFFFPEQCLIYAKLFSRELYKFSFSFYENTGPGMAMHACIPDTQKNVTGNMAGERPGWDVHQFSVSENQKKHSEGPLGVMRA